MKKQGFTLAEALITLAILGVVATIGISQVLTFANKYQSAAIASKMVYTIETGCQKVFNDYSNEKGGMSYVNKILLVNKWNERLARAIDLKMANSQIAWYDLFIAPAYASLFPMTTSTGNTITSSIKCSGSYCGGALTVTRPDGSTKVFPYSSGSNSSSGKEKPKPKPKPKPNNPDEPPVPETPVEPITPVNPVEPTPNPPVEPTPPVVSLDTPDTPDIPVPTPGEIGNGLDSIYRLNKIPGELRMMTIGASDENIYNPEAFIVLIFIDTNGFNKKPNKDGVDSFTYLLKNNGKMVPADDITKEFVRNGYKIK